MTDNLRDRIAAVQKAHVFCLVKCSCGYQIDSIHPSSPDWKTDAECDWADHVADALFLDPALQRQVMRALLPDERMPTMTVHNHGTEEGKGLACRESMVNGELKGECMSESQSPAVLGGVPMGDKYEKPRIRLWDNNFNLISDSHYCLRCGNVHPPGKCLRDNNDDGDDAA